MTNDKNCHTGVHFKIAVCLFVYENHLCRKKPFATI
jgi:hypothetical protein